MAAGERGTRGREGRGPRGRWYTRQDAADALGVTTRTVDRRRRDINPSGDLRVRRIGNQIRVWVPARVLRSPEVQLRIVERRLEEARKSNRRLQRQLRRARELFVEYGTVSEVDGDIEEWLTRQLRDRRSKRGSRGRGKRGDENVPPSGS